LFWPVIRIPASQDTTIKDAGFLPSQE
jgi:hypothetical protein